MQKLRAKDRMNKEVVRICTILCRIFIDIAHIRMI